MIRATGAVLTVLLAVIAGAVIAVARPALAVAQTSCAAPPCSYDLVLFITARRVAFVGAPSGLTSCSLAFVPSTWGCRTVCPCSAPLPLSPARCSWARQVSNLQHSPQSECRPGGPAITLT